MESFIVHTDLSTLFLSLSFSILGSIINVFGHRFIITGADLMVYRYMQANVEKFTADMIESYRNHFTKLGMLKDDYDQSTKHGLMVCHQGDADQSRKVIGDSRFDDGQSRKLMETPGEYSRVSGITQQVPPISDLIETKVMDAALKPRQCP
ncbi:hypothetical protein LSTR_LSTR017214 [Laodelphax striatellus]|uniref:Uncharacterized protein n=1 Tax=Laodelphax striatellus TaxID=195883 RepID=A0A482X0F3_LAOST|nr:hypothetical protein LSTR_LSTR017214 [Laodelphax striatellus]